MRNAQWANPLLMACANLLIRLQMAADEVLMICWDCWFAGPAVRICSLLGCWQQAICTRKYPCFPSADGH